MGAFMKLATSGIRRTVTFTLQVFLFLFLSLQRTQTGIFVRVMCVPLNLC